jgi:hypothetical protein
MDEQDKAAPARKPRGGRAGSVRWSQPLGQRIVARVAAGEMLYVMLREPKMPSAQSVRRWTAERPDFAEALEAARVAGGRPARGGGGVWTFCEATARAIFDRLCEGESLTSICRDPTMPAMSTVFYWRRAFGDFNATLRTAREIQAERFCELGWELASDAEPDTAYLTHVRLTQLRWMAGAMAPKAYRIKLVEPQAAQRRVDVLMRRFEIEADPATGRKCVVAYCPNPVTGEVEREDAPGWTPPPGTVGMPGGWDTVQE